MKNLRQYEKDEIEYIFKRIDTLYKKIGIYTVLITAFFFNTLKYFLPYLERLFVMSANNLSLLFQRSLGIDKDIYGLGDFLATFVLFPLFTISYLIIMMFWIYFIVSDYHQIKKLNSKLKTYDNKFNIYIIDPEKNIVISNFITKVMESYERCFDIQVNSKCKYFFTFLVLSLYIVIVILKM